MNLTAVPAVHARLSNPRVAPRMPRFCATANTAERSMLLLGDRTTVALAELMAIGHGLDLLVISACNSGIVEGGSTQALGWALDAQWLAAGHHAVISSLWRIDNDSTAALMCEFYHARRRGADKDMALAMAQRALIAGRQGDGRWRLPAYWAAMTFSGNWLGWMPDNALQNR